MRRYLRRHREATALLGALGGLSTLFAGFWLTWDWSQTLQRYFDPVKFRDFVFPAPFFLYTWRAAEWTAPFDLGLTLAGLGALILAVSAYFVGHIRA